jgi:hypothetical protein
MFGDAPEEEEDEEEEQENKKKKGKGKDDSKAAAAKQSDGGSVEPEGVTGQDNEGKPGGEGQVRSGSAPAREGSTEAGGEGAPSDAGGGRKRKKGRSGTTSGSESSDHEYVPSKLRK